MFVFLQSSIRLNEMNSVNEFWFDIFCCCCWPVYDQKKTTTVEAVLTSACHQFSNHHDHMVEMEPVAVKSEMEFQPEFCCLMLPLLYIFIVFFTLPHDEWKIKFKRKQNRLCHFWFFKVVSKSIYFAFVYKISRTTKNLSKINNKFTLLF